MRNESVVVIYLMGDGRALREDVESCVGAMKHIIMINIREEGGKDGQVALKTRE